MTNTETTSKLELAVLANILAHPAEAFDLISKAGIDHTYFAAPACSNAFSALLQADTSDKTVLIKTALDYLPSIKTPDEKNRFFDRDLIIKTPGYRGAFVYHIKQKGKRDE